LDIIADLHIHSTASDGELEPDRLVSLAVSKGLAAVSVTDHDTFAGIASAAESGNRHAIRVIPGVEISAEYEPGMLHILGYFPTYPAGMEYALAEVQKARRDRFPRIVKKLNELGIGLTEEDVVHVAGDAQIGRPHIAKALLKNGYVGSFDEAFDKYLSKGKKAYVPKEKMSWKDAVGLIRHHGGLPVLAHPLTLNLSEADLRAFIGEMKLMGLAGIEAHYPDHALAHTVLYMRIALDSGLIVTGGTDFHGPSRNAVNIGDKGIDSSLLKIFLDELMKEGKEGSR
jgi:hypothetical protein